MQHVNLEFKIGEMNGTDRKTKENKIEIAIYCIFF